MAITWAFMMTDSIIVPDDYYLAGIFAVNIAKKTIL